MRPRALPRHTALATGGILIGLAVWIVWGSAHYPAALWSPGDLSRHHADVADCGDCHQPFHGATVERCGACHDAEYFARHATPAVAEFHQTARSAGNTCTTCHIEHRGALAQITHGALHNPHGEFVFRATGTASCSACHDFTGGFARPPQLLDNYTVRRLFDQGEGAHRAGHLTQCLRCHRGGRLEAAEGNDYHDDEPETPEHD